MRDLKSVIEELGAMKPYEIAEHLREHGITGVRDDWDHCAVAEYVYREAGVRVTVSSAGIGPVYPYYSQGYKTPQSVDEFVVQFDDGKYPDLVAETEVVRA